MRYNSQCILVFSSTTIIPKKRAHARFCVIETVFFNYLFVTASVNKLTKKIICQFYMGLLYNRFPETNHPFLVRAFG